ncbi:glutamyl-tRNA(Gln) amidotransferase subunit A [Bryobacterales bacterium F-183]|nr:glutamyl-tRNA(Gln) amidotransferase subunit A [Bryobacterales bacterium F-183]
MIGDDVFYASAADLNRRLKAKEFSCVELTRAYCDRLEKLGPKYNALALSLRKTALSKAKDIDGEIKRERFRGGLQGVPFAVKDLLSVAKFPTTWGAKPYATQVFDYDATVVKKLVKSGGVLIGKLAMVELAGGGGYRYPAASLHGPGLNPWDTGRWSGGSSSGSGSAVAAGLTGYAIGSETNGSILTPSAFCGVTGLRPTYGLVSRYGAMALSWTMDKLGPMCRSAEDCGLVLNAIAGGDDQDPGSAGKSFYYTPQYMRPAKEIRIGYAPSDFAGAPEGAVRSAFQAAFQVFQGMGFAPFKEVALPEEYPYGAVGSTIVNSEAGSIFEELIASGKVDELADQRQAQGLKAGLEIPAKDYLKAMRIRGLIQQAFREMFANVDILLAPARNNVAPVVTEPLDRMRAAAAGTAGPGRPAGLGALTTAGNLAGLPALCLPCGFADGLPLAVQLVGRPFSENLLLKVGVDFQARTDFHKRRPPVVG